jgi:chromosome partitioning protein
MTHVVAVATGKGGVGKSSITSAVAGTLAAHGRRIAVIEIDPQGDIADDFGLREDPDNDGGETVAQSILHGTSLGQGIEARHNLTYFSGGPVLKQLPRLPGWTGLESQLGTAIGQLEGYDLIFLDSPPYSDELQRVSLTAADRLLIPTTVDNSSLRALLTIADRLVEVESVNPGLKPIGVVLWGVPTAASRIRSVTRQVLQEILGDAFPLLKTTIRAAAATAWEGRRRGMLPHEVAEMQSGPAGGLQALSPGRVPERPLSSAQNLALDYAALTNEILDRLEETS